ncbi:MAG: F0F1 ATP synthase subunit B [Candidatus Buchananbacteria bacterium]|nr:F0F1 ATP synthase subunit B [Candidatus Buchananbacteria bacterium]
MAEIISTFHIDWKIIIAQLVNFALVVGVLWFFAFKPLAKTMNERTAKIEQGLRNAQAVEQQLKEAEREYQVVVTRAKKEAEGIIISAREMAETQRNETLTKTKTEAAKIIETAKGQLAAQKQQMVNDARTELAEIVALASEKIIAQKLTDKSNLELIEKTIKGVKVS